MTGILNRTAFLRQAGEAFEAQDATDPREAASLLLLDIDRFKAINDGHGHAAGDAVIRAVADVLRETGAVAGRLGGEEFGLLLRGHGGGGATVAAHRIRTRCSGLRVRMATGTVLFHCQHWCRRRSAGERLEALLRRSDEALYAAKDRRTRPRRTQLRPSRTEIVS